jgi:ABC-type amino acid transport substrate-binding protein
MRSVALALALALALPGAVFARCEDFVPGQKPQNTPREFVGETMDQIVERGFIEFAVYENYPPYSWEEGATPRGVDIEIGRLIAESLQVEPRFRFVAYGETVEADLLNYVWKGAAIGGRVSNVMLRVPYDSAFTCRVEQVVFTGQYAGEKIAIAYSQAAYPDAVPGPDATGRHEGAPVPAYFRYDSVGVENDSIADFYLTSLPGGGTDAHMRRYRTTGLAMEALRAGEVMAVMGPQSELEWTDGDGIVVHNPDLPAFSVSGWTLGVAVHTSHRDLGYAVDDAIAAGLADGRIAAIYAQYGLDFIPPER